MKFMIFAYAVFLALLCFSSQKVLADNQMSKIDDLDLTIARAGNHHGDLHFGPDPGNHHERHFGPDPGNHHEGHFGPDPGNRTRSEHHFESVTGDRNGGMFRNDSDLDRRIEREFQFKPDFGNQEKSPKNILGFQML